MPGAILVIDDNDATLEFIDMLLRMSGYKVRTTASGAAGLRAATAGLLDRRLPNGDGVGVCQRLRDRLGPDVPIIMLTADHEPGAEVAARAAGATAFVRKPFAPPVLLDHLAELLPP